MSCDDFEDVILLYFCLRCGSTFAQSLGLIIARGRFVSGHVVRAFVLDTSPKCIDREGLGRRRTGTGQVVRHLLYHG